MSLLILAVVLAPGCGAKTETEDAPIPKAPPLSESKPAAGGTSEEAADSKAAGDVVKTGPFEKKFDRITVSVPAGWQEMKLGQSQFGFVDARFVLPAKAGLVELTCLSNRGGLDDNINRWIGQFLTDPDGKKSETIKVGDVEARWIDLKGTFNASSSGKPGPHPDWRMLGVGIPLGETDFFLKLNGPKDAVAEVYDAFREFVKTARIEQP
ncbi:MAG: hypothetical protein IT428_25165 [Planctomycetaceae bacterium]|nr:hypothetical protein [Planctomycetaceae bacterium]